MTFLLGFIISALFVAVILCSALLLQAVYRRFVVDVGGGVEASSDASPSAGSQQLGNYISFDVGV